VEGIMIMKAKELVPQKKARKKGLRRDYYEYLNPS